MAETYRVAEKGYWKPWIIQRRKWLVWRTLGRVVDLPGIEPGFVPHEFDTRAEAEAFMEANAP